MIYQGFIHPNSGCFSDFTTINSRSLQKRRSSVDAVVYLLTTNASLLRLAFPEDFHGYAVAWNGHERNHSNLWQKYLEQEQFTEDSLQDQFFVVHRQGPAPMYLRTLLRAGDLSNALSIMENYFLYLKESGHHLEHVRLYNAADQDLTTWQQESSFGNLGYTLENERLEPKNGGSVQMICPFNWMVFTFF